MDIAGLSVSLSQAQVMNDFGVAMLSKSMDTVEALSAGMVEMIDASAMELSVNPAVGSNIDIRV
ncbi:MAG: YjfB family protein [Lachnospiraceae bacterium]|nr:YjfB family protein [Lachnospiraceae bacterium]